MMKIYCSHLSFILVARTKYVRAQDRPQTRQWEPAASFVDEEAPSSTCWPAARQPLFTPCPMRAQPHGFHRPGCVLTRWGGFLIAYKAEVEANGGTVRTCYCKVGCKVEQEAEEVWEVQLYKGVVMAGLAHGLRMLFIRTGWAGWLPAGWHGSCVCPFPLPCSHRPVCRSGLLACPRQEAAVSHKPSKGFSDGVVSHISLSRAQVSAKAGFGAEKEAVEEREQDPFPLLVAVTWGTVCSDWRWDSPKPASQLPGEGAGLFLLHRQRSLSKGIIDSLFVERRLAQ